MTARQTVRLGRLLGVELRLDYSWFLVFALVTWSLAMGHFPLMNAGWSALTYWGIGLATSLFLFACVVLHVVGGLSGGLQVVGRLAPRTSLNMKTWVHP